MTLGGGLKVTQSGAPAMSVDVALGTCLVPGTEGAKQGQYTVVNDATVTLTVTAAHATLPRIDLVTMTIQDAQYSGAANQALLVVTAGTPAASPVAPTAPANSLILAQIAVGAAVSSIVNANITDRRTPITASGGLQVVSSANRPTNGLYEGESLYVTDRDWYETYDGTAWKVRGTAVVANFAALSNITSPYVGQVVNDAAGNVWWWTGSIWAPKLLSGTASLSFTSLNSFSQNVSFAQAFAGTPNIMTNIHSGAGATAQWGSRAINGSTTQFAIFVFVGSGTSTWAGVTVQWVATL